MSLLRRGGSGPVSDAERKQRGQQRASRYDLVRQARTATREMKPPEPVRGLYVSAFMLAVGVVSYLGTDTTNQVEKVGKKTVTHAVIVHHPPQAVILIVLALAAAGTIYWRRRLVTGIAFMLTAAIGVGTPLPKGVSDGTWLTFLVPAAYVLWMLIFRMNKEQKEWLAEHRASSSASAGASRTSSRKGGGARSNGSRRGKDKAPTTPSGRPLPSASARYTPPRAKTKAGQRKP